MSTLTRTLAFVALLGGGGCTIADAPFGGGDRSDFPGDDDGGGVDGGGVLPDADPGLRGWRALGAPLATSATYAAPAIARGADGQPLVAFLDGTGADVGIDVHRYVEDAWVRVGSKQSTAGFGAPPALAAGDASAWLAWPVGGDGNAARHLEDGAWTTPAGTPLGSSSTYLPHTTIAVADDGAPWVAYSEHLEGSSTEEIYVQARAAGAFGPRGAKITIGGNQSALAPRLATGGGEVAVAYQGDGVYARRWDGSGWALLGGGAIVPPAESGASSASTASLAIDGEGRAVVAYHAYVGGDDGTVGFVARWDGDAWDHLGVSLQAYDGASPDGASYASMQDVAAAADGTIYVAWSEEDAAGEAGIHVARCDDGGCAPLGEGRLDAVAGGEATWARLAIDGAQRPVVAWAEEVEAGGADAIHVWTYYGDPDPSADDAPR
jgi:hypothetical protein